MLRDVWWGFWEGLKHFWLKFWKNYILNGFGRRSYREKTVQMFYKEGGGQKSIKKRLKMFDIIYRRPPKDIDMSSESKGVKLEKMLFLRQKNLTNACKRGFTVLLPQYLPNIMKLCSFYEISIKQ